MENIIKTALESNPYNFKVLKIEKVRNCFFIQVEIIEKGICFSPSHFIMKKLEINKMQMEFLVTESDLHIYYS
jgi:hypothetical protein